MAQWAMHFIKLFYTEEHLKRFAGKDGNLVFQKVTSDMVEEGMEVTVSASAVDKNKRQQQATAMAQMKLTDPLSFYEDMDMSNPKDRAEKVIMFNADPAGYMTKYLMNMTVQDQANALNAPPAQEGQEVPPQGAPLPPPQAQQPQQGQPATNQPPMPENAPQGPITSLV